MTETLPLSKAPQKQGWWADHENHPYHRLNVEKYIDEFCGWHNLEKLISYIPDEMQKAYFVTLFQTGGRATETLLLTKEVFTVLPEDGVIKVKGMKMLKRYEKTDSYKDEQGKNHWVTEKDLSAVRKTFVIKRSEPFSPILERYLEGISNPEAYLFPSPQIHSRRYRKTHSVDESLLVNGQFPYSRKWAYRVIRDVNDKLPQDLKEKLGLNQPFIVSEFGKAVKISDKIHLWLHFFRSQKASQLVNDYGFEVMDLVGYFTWKDYETALRYAKKGWRGLLDKMNRANAVYA